MRNPRIIIIKSMIEYLKEEIRTYAKIKRKIETNIFEAGKKMVKYEEILKKEEAKK